MNNGEINEDLNEFLNQFDLNAETVLVTDLYPKPILAVSSNAYGYPEIVCYDLHSIVELYSTDQGFFSQRVEIICRNVRNKLEQQL